MSSAIDAVGDESQIENELNRLFPPVEKLSTSNRVVIVDGAPIVGADKLAKLEKVLQKHLLQFGPVIKFDSPVDSSNNTQGFHFAEFGSAAEAKECAAQLNGFQMDKQHTLLVNLLSEFEALEKLPDDADKVDGATADEVRVENLHGWLEDARSVSQYAVVFAGRAEIYWNEQKGNSKAELIYGRDNWTESFVSWSPQGTYFVTMHRQGVALWGGPSWKRLIRFGHVGCDVAQFSPRENYLITFSPQFVEGDNPEDPKAIVVWDVRTGKLLRSFLNGVTPFGWSHDDKYFARLDTDRVQVYETPSMGLHQKKSIAATGVTDFAWSPTANILAFFTPEHDGQAASITLLEFPSRRVLRTKALFNVSGAKLHWHPQGHFLCAKVDRIKTKKVTITNFEIFRMREKDVPVDVFEHEDAIAALAWEPHGKRLAFAHGEGPRHNITFISVEADKVVVHATLDKKPANSLFWSPRGKYIVLAGLRNLNGQLEFYNVETKETMAVEEHFMATSVEWDASGLYCASVVSAWRQSLETGVSIYNFHGQKVHSRLRDQFYQLAWRPRPQSLLSATREREIEANLDSYIASIRADDAKAAEAIREADRRERAATVARFADKVADARKRYEAAREKRIAVYGFDPDAPLAADQFERIKRTDERVLESITTTVE